jgi:hypothetical protein
MVPVMMVPVMLVACGRMVKEYTARPAQRQRQLGMLIIM